MLIDFRKFIIECSFIASYLLRFLATIAAGFVAFFTIYYFCVALGYLGYLSQDTESASNQAGSTSEQTETKGISHFIDQEHGIICYRWHDSYGNDMECLHLEPCVTN